MEHTPEPWEYDGGIVVRRDGVKIARLALNGSAIEVRGNGRLIAAGPDMEAALEVIAGLPHGAPCEGFGARRLLFPCSCHVLIAKAALAKARGHSL